MKWLILAIGAEISVLLCLIYTFDGALHSWQSARLTWDHAAVAIVYAFVRVEFSRKRLSRPSTLLKPAASVLDRRQSLQQAARVSVR
jgi:hypothetical protein